jgi:predicted lysophospholipase L1 biosynthesis ABC-type transport system permease subunit
VLIPGSAPQTAGLRVAPGRNVDAERARAAQQLGVSVEDTMLSPPGAIINLARITFVPYALSVLLLALAAVVLASALWTSVRRREQQIAILRALGADRGWLRIAATWQALAFTVVPSLIGAVMGLIAGRLVFADFARGKGVVDDVAAPWALALGSLALLVLVALVATTLAGRRALNGDPAPLLRVG